MILVLFITWLLFCFNYDREVEEPIDADALNAASLKQRQQQQQQQQGKTTLAR